MFLIFKKENPSLHLQNDDQRLVYKFQRKESLISHSAAGKESPLFIFHLCTVWADSCIASTRFLNFFKKEIFQAKVHRRIKQNIKCFILKPCEESPLP